MYGHRERKLRVIPILIITVVIIALFFVLLAPKTAMAAEVGGDVAVAASGGNSAIAIGVVLVALIAGAAIPDGRARKHYR
ncbi:MAG: hypothetical protein LBN30_03190 [Oscillospiraceae bacterium]|jgi:hypothetical protein|nr:hypothetical protein [Oscillospiraceae bacterium]